MGYPLSRIVAAYRRMVKLPLCGNGAAQICARCPARPVMLGLRGACFVKTMGQIHTQLATRNTLIEGDHTKIVKMILRANKPPRDRLSFCVLSGYNYGMTLSSQAPINEPAGQLPPSETVIVELENRVTRLESQLLAANVGLQREIADRRQKEVEFRRSTEQLRELSARLQTVREEERTKIARAIHDELGQTLTGIKMDLSWLQKHLNEQESTLLKKTEAMSDLIDLGVQAVRRIATELRPGILDLSLVATIDWQLQEFQARSGIHTKLISAPEDTTLDVDGATTVFRIFQEILTNVTRHARATQIEVSLVEDATFLTLVVKDNGCGITDREISSPKSIGLLGMQERARLRAGEIHFQGTPNLGTTVTVRLPLATGEAKQHRGTYD